MMVRDGSENGDGFHESSRSQTRWEYLFPPDMVICGLLCRARSRTTAVMVKCFDGLLTAASTALTFAVVYMHLLELCKQSKDATTSVSVLLFWERCFPAPLCQVSGWRSSSDLSGCCREPPQTPTSALRLRSLLNADSVGGNVMPSAWMAGRGRDGASVMLAGALMPPTACCCQQDLVTSSCS